MQPLIRDSRSGYELFLLPFKTYVVIMLPTFLLFRHALHTAEVVLLVLLGYAVSLFVLVLGAVIQACRKNSAAAIRSIAFAVLAFISGCYMLRYLAA